MEVGVAVVVVGVAVVVGTCAVEMGSSPDPDPDPDRKRSPLVESVTRGALVVRLESEVVEVGKEKTSSCNLSLQLSV